MNTYQCAELRAKHDYSSITTTLTLQLVHRQLQINIDDSIATIHALTGDWLWRTVHVRLSEDIDMDRR